MFALLWLLLTEHSVTLVVLCVSDKVAAGILSYHCIFMFFK